MKPKELLRNLAKKRPLFHSEKDFQFALAWEIQTLYPDAKIRLEYRPAVVNTKMYIDLWVVFSNGKRFAIELKYKTHRLNTKVAEETYQLLGQGAQDVGRCDFCRDVHRLESLTAADPSITGVVILLTNDPSYWKLTGRSNTNDAAFRLQEGRRLSGQLAWGPAASAGTMKRRENPLKLAAEYNIAWTPFSEVTTKNNWGIFKYCLIDVIAGQDLRAGKRLRT